MWSVLYCHSIVACTYIHITALLCHLVTTVGELQIVDNGLSLVTDVVCSVLSLVTDMVCSVLSLVTDMVCSVLSLVTDVVCSVLSFDRCLYLRTHITALLCHLVTTVGELQIVDNGF